MTKTQKRAALIILLLLLAAACIWFFLFKNRATGKPYIRQGLTTIRNKNPEFKIWDFHAEDGDTVNVYFDEKLVFKKLPIRYEPIRYNPGHLSSGDHIIAIEAVNEGMMGPASPHLSVHDMDTTFDFDIDAWIDSPRSSWIIHVE
jgi:hypothetical protein